MGMPPHIKCCGCCCTLHMGAMIGTALYILFSLITGTILPLAWTQRDTSEAKAFCAGTTAAYRVGNDVNSFNTCHGSDICPGTDWDEVDANARVSWAYGIVMNIVTLLLLIGTMALIVKKHSEGLNISCKLLAVMPLLFLLEPITQVAFASSQRDRFHGNEYYVMAAKDILCGNQNAGNAGLLPDATTYIKPSKTEMEDYCTSSDCTSSDLEKIAKMCKDQKWVGAPDPTDDLKDNWGRDPCKEPPAFGMFVMPFIWYFVFYLGLLSYLIFNIWSLKEELAGAPKNDTEMGAAKPAVAVAVATAAA